MMSPELQRVLDVLARHKVCLPVGALVELGLVQEWPEPSLSYAQMQDVAARRGLVRWTYSGVVERVVISRSNPRGFTAWGFFTRPHFLPPMRNYKCDLYGGGRLSAIGDPYRIPPNLLRENPSARPPPIEF